LASLEEEKKQSRQDGRRRGGAAAEAGGDAPAPGQGPAAQRLLLHHQPTTLAYVSFYPSMSGFCSSYFRIYVLAVQISPVDVDVSTVVVGVNLWSILIPNHLVLADIA
jgi:hypothetical protein